MIPREIKKSLIFAEFNPQKQAYWFDYSRDKVIPHIDTLYYSVSIYNDSNENDNVLSLINVLKELKEAKISNIQKRVDFFGLSLELKSFSNYSLCLSLNENFDFFFCTSIMTPDTPRVVVQLRTRALVLNGVMQTVCKSFRYVEDILSAFNLEVSSVKENRIDYAYHTNLIQCPYKFLKDEYIVKSIKSKMRYISKVGKIRGDDEFIDYEYISIGNRRSNNIFVRMYNKSQEVIRLNYKSFFFARWLENKLINQYDFYCYEKAYSLRSYYTGLLIGRIDWYLEHGSDEEIKRLLSDLKQSCYVSSDNISHLKKIVDKYLPPVTLIMNVEFQTKRKFYHDCNDFIETHYLTPHVFRSNLVDSNLSYDDINPLSRLQKIYSLKAEICHYLTTETLCFVKNKGNADEKLANWWKRINDVTIDDYRKGVSSVWRLKDRSIDEQRARQRFYSSVAYLKLVSDNSLCDKGDFVEDISDVLCTFNDNDVFYGFALDPVSGRGYEIGEKEEKNYNEVKQRKIRQNKGILEEFQKNKNNLEEDNKNEN